MTCTICTVYTYDRENHLLFTLDAAGGEHRISVTSSTVAGEVCLTAKPQRIDNVYQDSRFNQMAGAAIPPKSGSEGSEASAAGGQQANMLCCPVLRGSQVLGIIQCVRDTPPLFSLSDEEWLIDFAQQVAMAALHTFHENSAAYKVFGLVDALCTISSEVRDSEALQTNIKNVVRGALVCEKVNVYSIDTMRQELLADSHLAHQDTIHDITAQIKTVEAEVRQGVKAGGESGGGASEQTDLGAHSAAEQLAKLKSQLDSAVMLQDASKGMHVRIKFKQGLVGLAAASGGFQNTQHISSTTELVDYEGRSVHGRPVRNMLCACVYTEDGDLVGLIQAINKKHGVFTSADEKLVQTLAAQAGVMLHHSQLLITMRKQSLARFDLCQYAVKVLDCKDNLDVCKMVEIHGAKVMNARKCSLWIYEQHRHSIWTVDSNGEVLRKSLREVATTVVGKAAVSGEMGMQNFSELTEGTNSAEDDEDMLNDDAIHKEHGQRSHMGSQYQACILAQPVLSSSDRSVLLGVVECINKRDGVYDQDDQYVISLLATMTAAALENLRGSVATGESSITPVQNRRISSCYSSPPDPLR